MGFLQSVTDFFESIFFSSSPEIKKKQTLKKIDLELRSFHPVIYKNGVLQPNLAEIFRILYENTKPVDNILSVTISSEDIKRNNRFENQLILTGFTGNSQERLEHINFENRKKEVIDSNLSMNRVFENQKHTLESLIKELNTPDFVRIDEIIGSIQQLTDICRYNYLSVIHKFDPDYDGMNMNYKPEFMTCSLDGLANSLQDLYYLIGNFKLTTSVARAVNALNQLYKGDSYTKEDEEKLLGNLKKINSVFRKTLTPEILKKMIQLAKKEPEFIPQIASYKINARQKFANYIQEQFIADETRIKNEIKDKRISTDLNRLFGEKELENYEGYNTEFNLVLRQNTSFSFNWITPMQVLKTFIVDYFGEQVRAFLNDIVIEGFFNNSADKTDFSSIVFSCCESISQITLFEESFSRGKENDLAVLNGYIKDSHTDADFVKKLERCVDNINEQAHQVVQTIVTNIVELYKLLGELFVDAKKTKPDIISNIKVLMTSSRNRDNARQLEQQYEQWGIFLDIMKNYAIIGEINR